VLLVWFVVNSSSSLLPLLRGNFTGMRLDIFHKGNYNVKVLLKPTGFWQMFW
jgi:hypothetical protein